MSRVVFDARAAFPARDGLGTYLREVVPRIVAEATDIQATILVNPRMIAFWHDAAPRATVVSSPCRAMGLTQHWQVPRLLDPLRPDLYFYPAHDPPLTGRTPLVFTIQDLTPHVVRPYFERLNGPKTAYLRHVTGSALKRARRVIVTSAATTSSVARVYGTRFLDKIRTTPLAVEGEFPRRRVPVDDARCLLYVGTDRPHKNLDRLIAAYAVARSRCPAVPPLEIVGGLRREPRLRGLIQREGIEGAANLRGHVTDAELEAYYARAVALVVPSLAEGFGLPVLEAMIRLVPVITSNRSACAEVAGGAALLVDPDSVESIADGMVKVASDPLLCRQLIRLGEQRASSFSWTRCASETLDVIREAVRVPSFSGASPGRRSAPSRA